MSCDGCVLYTVTCHGMTSKKIPLPKRLSRVQYGLKGKRTVSFDTALLRELWFNVLPKNLELKTTDGSLDQNFRSTYTAVVSSNSIFARLMATIQFEYPTLSDGLANELLLPIIARLSVHDSILFTRTLWLRDALLEKYMCSTLMFVFPKSARPSTLEFVFQNAAFEQMPMPARSVGAITSLTFHPTADLLFASTAHGLFIINWRKSLCLHSIDFESKFLLWMQFDAAGSCLYAAFENIVGERKGSIANDQSIAAGNNNLSFRRRPLLRLARSANRPNDIAPPRNVVSAAEVEPSGSRRHELPEPRIGDRGAARVRGHHLDSDDSELVVHQLFRQAEAILHRLAATASRLGNESNPSEEQPSSSNSNSVAQQQQNFNATTPRGTLSAAASNARMLNVFLEGRPPIPPASVAAAAASASVAVSSGGANAGENYSSRMSQLEVQIRETRRRLEQLRDSLHRIQEGLMPPMGNSIHRQVVNAVEPPLARLRSRLLIPPAGPGVRALLDDLHSHYQQGPSCPALFGEAPTELFRWDLENSKSLTSLTDKDIVMEKITECIVRGESAINLSTDGTRIACFVPSNSFSGAKNLVLSSNSPLTTPSTRNDSGTAPTSNSGRSPVVVVPGSPSLIRTMVAVFDITSSGRYSKVSNNSNKGDGDKVEERPSTSSVTPMEASSSSAAVAANTYWLPIASTTFEGAGTSLCFSPDGNFLVIGFSLRSANISSLTSPVLRIFEINSHSGTLRTLCHVRHPTSEPFWELPRLAVNCLVWVDHSRGGIIYGTNQGHVVRCCPMTRSAYSERNKSTSHSALSAEHNQLLASLRIPPSFVPIVPLDLQMINNNNNNNNNAGA